MRAGLGQVKLRNSLSIKEVGDAPEAFQSSHGLGGCHPDVAGEGQGAIHFNAEDVDRRLEGQRSPPLER